jgi:hypothetical protein
MLNKIQALAVIPSFLTLIACSDNGIDSSNTEHVADSYEQDSYIESISKGISDNLYMIKKDLPITIDDVTTLESIDSDELSVIYDYRLKVSGLNDSEKSKLESDIKNENTKSACNNPDMSKFLELGVSYIYNYHDLDNIRINGFEVTKDICDNL